MRHYFIVAEYKVFYQLKKRSEALNSAPSVECTMGCPLAVHMEVVMSLEQKIGYEFSIDKNVLRNHDALLLMEKNI